jgi:hypothetical protein
MFRARGAHHQERPNFINTASGNCHSVLVAVSCDGWELVHQVGYLPEMKSSSLLPCVIYVVASLSVEPVHFVLNTAQDSHHVIIDIKTSLQFKKMLQKGHFYHSSYSPGSYSSSDMSSVNSLF